MSDAVVTRNIGPAGEARRRTAGWVLMSLGVLYVAGTMWRGFDPVYRLVAFVPFLTGALGFFQAAAHTCVTLSRANVMDLDDGRGAVRVTDAEMHARISRQARAVWVRSILLAAVLTGTAYQLPRHF